MNFNSLYLRAKLKFMPLLRVLALLFRAIDVTFCLLTLGVFIYQFGFGISDEKIKYTSVIYEITFIIYFIRFSFWTIRNIKSTSFKSRRFYEEIFLYFLVLITFLVGWVLSDHIVTGNSILLFFRHEYVVYFFVGLHVIVTLSQAITRSLNKQLNPNWLFVGSFLFMIFAGAGLLMLPKATNSPISLLQAIFTSVSAVCVTGLVVVDTAATFTPIGKIIIALLIQAGGIGIMTFTSFFGLFSDSKQSFQNQFIIKNLIGDNEGISHLFSTLRNTILVTFLVEIIGAVLLFYTSGGKTLNDLAVSGFHSVSAFCNAGFSILPDGFYNSDIRNNYSFLTVISFLIIIGGLGFPIIFNIYTWLKYYIGNTIRHWFGRQKNYKHIPRIVSSNTIIVLVTTLFLLVSGTLLFYFTEFDNVLQSQNGIGKFVTAFFMSVTPRTAGFNSFDMTQLMPVTLLWMIVFMWIGASPMSTGGGIKTTTFGIAVLNVWNTILGRDKIEIRYRQIAPSTINRAFVIIFMSISIISLATIIISILEPQLSLRLILFECVSAISTVGLSVNVTPSLSHSSQIIIILLMFVGRIGFFSILNSFIKAQNNSNYQFPSEIISIN